jgi:hypothetical protein
VRSPLPRTLAPLILVVLAFSACALAPVAFGRVTPAPYYLPDTSASALDVTLSITVGGNSLSSVGARVSVLFSVPGHLVAFRDGETLSCDGAAPEVLSSIRYGAEDEFSPPGVGTDHPFSCSYTSKGRCANFAVVIPVAPEIITPTEGATLPREQALPVTYQSITGSAELEAFSGANIPPTDTSVKITDPNQTALNTSAFVAGPGQIEITETPAVRVIATGGFHSFTADCGATALIHVTWE